MPKQLLVGMVLVVDDTPDNLAAARAVFERLAYPVTTARSAAEAMSLIESAYQGGNKFYFVFTDLEMEQTDSGLMVAQHAFKYQAMPFIVTGKKGSGQGHGPVTYVAPCEKGGPHLIENTKDTPTTWDSILEVAEIFLAGRGKNILPKLQQDWEANQQPSDYLAECFMSLFDWMKK